MLVGIKRDQLSSPEQTAISVVSFIFRCADRISCYVFLFLAIHESAGIPTESIVGEEQCKTLEISQFRIVEKRDCFEDHSMDPKPVNWSKSLMAWFLVKEVSGGTKSLAVVSRPPMSRVSRVEKATTVGADIRRNRGAGVMVYSPENVAMRTDEAGEREGVRGMSESVVELNNAMHPARCGLPQNWPCWMIAMSAHSSTTQL